MRFVVQPGTADVRDGRVVEEFLLGGVAAAQPELATEPEGGRVRRPCQGGPYVCAPRGIPVDITDLCSIALAASGEPPCFDAMSTRLWFAYAL